MKKIFVSHPFTGNEKENREKATKVCEYILRLGHLPLSPVHWWPFLEKDGKYRKDIMEVCYHMIEIADEIWIHGKSPGCRAEEKYAEKLGKPILRNYEKINFKKMMEEPPRKS